MSATSSLCDLNRRVASADFCDATMIPEAV